MGNYAELVFRKIKLEYRFKDLGKVSLYFGLIEKELN